MVSLAQADLQLGIFLPLLLEYWDYRHAPPHLTSFPFLFRSISLSSSQRKTRGTFI
jgi:hypothetical protein